jgi:hypothetical protein
VMYLVALSLLSIVPVGDVTRESVDAVEVNAFYEENGRHVFTQAIFKTWNGKRFDVVAWRLMGDGNYASDGKLKSQPERDFQNGGYVLIWHDGNLLRQVRTPSVDFSWTQVDVELLAREVLAKDLRRELRPSPYAKLDKPAGAIRPSPIPVAAPDLP